jgi:hypothetical protein
MKILDSIIVSKSPLSGSDQYPTKESLKAFSSKQHNELKSTVALKSEVSDIVSLTVQAKLSSMQYQSPVITNSTNQSDADYESKGNEAIVQLIEMLTGIKVKLLKQADLLEEAEKRREFASKMDKVQQRQDPVAETSKVSGGTENSAIQTKGILKFADGKEVHFTLDVNLPKDIVSSVGLSKNPGRVSRNGIEIYLQEHMNDAPSQEPVVPIPVKIPDGKDIKRNENISGKVIGRLNVESKLEQPSNHYVISA